MKKYKKHLCLTLATAGFLATMSLTSCSDFMDLKPTDQYDEEMVWSDAALVQAYINDVYSFVRHGSEESSTTGISDDAYFTHDYGCKAVMEATISPSDVGWYDDTKCPFYWKRIYQGIYEANSILENIGNVPESVGYNLTTMEGETRFLRAFLYFDLVRGYGGVPIVDKVYTLEEAAALQLPRSNINECMEFILSDVEQAINMLPESADAGRVTKGAAMAFKARVLLQFASPLYADRTVNTLECNQYNGDQRALYEQALQAAKDVINSGYYTLVDCNAGTPEEIGDLYHEIAITNNSESIWYRQFLNKDVTDDDNVLRNRAALCHGPNGYHNWGGVTPTNDLAMSFEMADGSLYEGLKNPGDKATENPYYNRDPRFYATLGCDGQEWGRPRGSDATALDPTPLGTLQMGYYEVNNGTTLQITTVNNASGTAVETVSFTGIAGLDTRSSSIEDWNGSYTGYIERKLIDESVEATEHNFQTATYPQIRFAEMYLIAAEAAIELGQIDEAATYLDALRARIGMPDTRATLAVRGKSFNQADMREFLRQQRRSELAFEESRFFDIRRWMIAPDVVREPTAICVVARLKPGQTAELPYVHDDSKWDYTYSVLDLSYRELRKWDNKLYFAPITREEMNRNTAMVQNPGY